MHRHDTDVTSLVAGLVLVGIASVWGLVEISALTLSALPVLVPTLLVVIGVLGVALAVSRSRHDNAEPDL